MINGLEVRLDSAGEKLYRVLTRKKGVKVWRSVPRGTKAELVASLVALGVPAERTNEIR